MKEREGSLDGSLVGEGNFIYICFVLYLLYFAYFKMSTG